MGLILYYRAIHLYIKKQDSAKLYTMDILFWICWIAEMGVVAWWIISELQLRYLSPNIFSFLSLFYLLTVLFIRFEVKWDTVSVFMVGLPAIPLSGMLLIIILHMLSGRKWN